MMPVPDPFSVPSQFCHTDCQRARQGIGGHLPPRYLFGASLAQRFMASGFDASAAELKRKGGRMAKCQLPKNRHARNPLVLGVARS